MVHLPQNITSVVILSSQGKPERAAHWLTDLSLHKAGFVTHK